MIVTIRFFILLVHPVGQRPPAISTLYKPGEYLRCAALLSPAAAGYVLLHPVKVGLAYNGFMGALYLPSFTFGLADFLLALK